MKKWAIPFIFLIFILPFYSCDNINLVKAAYTGIYTEVPVTPEPVSFAIVIVEGSRLNYGAIKGADPVNLKLYFFDSMSVEHDITAETTWESDPVAVASFDDPVSYNGRLWLHLPGDVMITAAYQSYPQVSASVHINGPGT